jgi:uncharacterized membrane protein YbhN (UPF0104 family)
MNLFAQSAQSIQSAKSIPAQSVQSAPGLSTWSQSAQLRRLVRGLKFAIPLLLLVALVARLGTDPFERSLQVLSPGPIIAALLLGVITTTAQALRWRTVAIGHGAASGLTRTRAVEECYRAALLNAVLPGGVVGDGLRAWRQRAPLARGLRSSAQAVIGERVVGTTILLVAVAAVIAPVEPRMSVLVLFGAAVAALVAAPSLRRLSRRGQFAVGGWSVLALASLVTKFALAAATLGTVPRSKDVVALALIVLAGMAIPVGVAGFGPREAVAAIAFGAFGLSADAGVATSAAYGVLAALSALPGAAVMLLDLRRDGQAQRDAASQDAPQTNSADGAESAGGRLELDNQLRMDNQRENDLVLVG